MGSHEFCWVLTTGPAAVPHTIVIHAKSEERGVSSRHRGNPPSSSHPPLPRVPWPHVCPISWAMVNAVARPMSSLILQLLSRSHIPPTGARPGKGERGRGQGTQGWTGSIHHGRSHPRIRAALHGACNPRTPYLECRRVCSCRCRCHSCGNRRQRGLVASQADARVITGEDSVRVCKAFCGPG